MFRQPIVLHLRGSNRQGLAKCGPSSESLSGAPPHPLYWGCDPSYGSSGSFSAFAAQTTSIHQAQSPVEGAAQTRTEMLSKKRSATHSAMLP